MDEPSPEQFEPQTHSFIVKLWIEDKEDGTGRSSWRGYITHVPGNERQYLKHLLDITDFVAMYLGKMGADIGAYRWVPRVRARYQQLRNRIAAEFAWRPFKRLP
jgi:hypothetical protein